MKTLRQLLSLSAALLAALTGCAGNRPVFTPPTERPLPLHEKPWPHNQVLTLAYHDVVDTDPDQQYVATRTANFVAQLRWLRINHYTPVSMDQILAARDGKAALPDKAVLLTFDDGYRSMYDRVYPILKRFHWPAIAAPVGVWMNTPQGQLVNFSGQPRPRDKFLTWDQVREMSDSGLIEIASHSQDLHRGVLANPQGNKEPAATSRQYDPVQKRYETLDEFRQRIDRDVTTMSDTLKRVTGKSPRVWVWPYGASSGIALDVLRAHGYQSAMTLEDGVLNVNDLMNAPRVLVANDPDIEDFAASVIQAQEQENVRSVRIDLDQLYDADPKKMDDNVGRTVQRLSELEPSVAFIKGFVTPRDHSGLVREVYFPNQELPMKADLFNRVVHQIQSRVLRRVYVYAWLPTLTANVGGALPVGADSPQGRAPRVSADDPAVQQKLRLLYRDMAASVPTLEGVVFDDGAPSFASNEAANSGALLSQYRLQDQLIREVRAVRGADVKVASVIPADRYRSAAARQQLAELIARRNSVILKISPAHQGPESDSAPRRQALDQIAAVKAVPNGLKQTLFEIQRWDERGERLSNAQLTAWLVWLANQGVINVGYANDDPLGSRPDIHNIAPFFETHWEK